MRKYPEIDEDIFMKHLESAYCETLKRKYSTQGYEVLTEYKLPNGVRADFVAKKNNETIIIEIKNGKLKPEKKDAILAIKDFADKNKESVKCRIAFINPPQSQKIEFDDLGTTIFKDMNNNLPDELDRLAAHVYPEEISDIEIEDMRIHGKEIALSGTGIVKVEMQIDSEKDETNFFDSFPFQFKIKMDKDFNIKDADYDIDTSSYYDM